MGLKFKGNSMRFQGIQWEIEWDLIGSGEDCPSWRTFTSPRAYDHHPGLLLGDDLPMELKD